MRGEGKLFIDGRDALLEWGLFVEKGSYKALVQLPAFKKLDTTEWCELDGVEVDLTAPVLNTKTFSITFCCTNIEFAEDFYDEISTGSYHVFDFVELGKSYKLRLVQSGTFSQLIRLGKMTLSFADDFPIVPQGEHLKYGKSGIKQNGYELDGVDFSQFGTYVLKGSDEQIRKVANVRSNLTIDNKSIAGVGYDEHSVVFKQKDVALSLLIQAENISEFWQRWDSLFAIVLKPESRSFYFSTFGHEYECYYKSCNVSKFEILSNGHVWCEFKLNLTFTSYRPAGNYQLLATEDFDWIITEDAVDPARIKIRPKSNLILLISEDGEYVITEDGDSKIYFNH